MYHSSHGEDGRRPLLLAFCGVPPPPLENERRSAGLSLRLEAWDIDVHLGKGDGERVGRSSYLIDTTALWKDIRFTSERHRLRYVVGG